MAIGQVSTTNGTAGTSAGQTATATVTADVDDVLIVVAGSDNRVVANEALGASAVTDSSGNTWTRLLTQQSTATASSHAALAIYGCTIVTGKTLTGGTVTLTAQANVPVKDFTLYRFTGLSLTIRAANGGIVTATTPAALASSAPLDGDLVIGATVLEGPTSDTWTADSDTTNGSWSANATDGTTGGTATSQISIRSQYKIVNAAGTQTYNGANSVSRDMARGLLVLAPTPPPSAVGLPPAYVRQYNIRFSTGLSRMTSGQQDTYAIGDNFDPRLPPVVFMPGVYNTSTQITGSDLPGVQAVVGALVDQGFVLVAPTTLGTFGNPTGRTGITDALAYARSTFGCSTKPAPLIGLSEGASDVMTFAYLNPTLVACIVGLIPIIDLSEIVEQNVLGLASAVLAAWSVGGLPLPSDADPMTAGHQATLATIPMQHWYSTDDEVSANITAFRNGTNCDVRAVGPLGHTSAAIAAAWPTDIARFVRKRVPVPYRRGDLS